MTNDRVQRGKVVAVTYTILDGRGKVFEQSDLPISYLHGGDSGLFEKIERALDGRAIGDSIEVTLMPEEGFGDRDPAMVFIDDLDNVPAELQHVGARLEAQNEQGEVREFIVTRIQDDRMTVDGNHPLAGQTVTFQVSVADIREPTPDERRTGQVAGSGRPTLQ